MNNNGIEVLRAFSIFAIHLDREALMWRVNGEEVKFLLDCSDFFAWATSDCEEITDEDIPDLKQAEADIIALETEDTRFAYDDFITLLWIARKQKMRPQVAYYKHIPEKLHALFDACNDDPAAQYGTAEFNAKWMKRNQA